MNAEALAWYAQAAPRHWCGGDAWRTRLLESVSLLAPEVERFFIGAMLDSLEAIEDPGLAERCMLFVREEAGHSREHRQFNRRLVEQGLDAARVLGPVRRLVEWARRRLPARWRLELSAAGEHLSALASRRYLQAAPALAICSLDIDELFRRHAREELGHCAEVYDALRATGAGRWFSRLLALAAVSLVAGWCLCRVLDALLRLDAPSGHQWRRGALRLLHGARPAGLLGEGLRYLRPGFHPVELLRDLPYDPDSPPRSAA